MSTTAVLRPSHTRPDSVAALQPGHRALDNNMVQSSTNMIWKVKTLHTKVHYQKPFRQKIKCNCLKLALIVISVLFFHSVVIAVGIHHILVVFNDRTRLICLTRIVGIGTDRHWQGNTGHFFCFAIPTIILHFFLITLISYLRFPFLFPQIHSYFMDFLLHCSRRVTNLFPERMTWYVKSCKTNTYNKKVVVFLFWPSILSEK